MDRNRTGNSRLGLKGSWRCGIRCRYLTNFAFNNQQDESRSKVRRRNVCSQTNELLRAENSQRDCCLGVGIGSLESTASRAAFATSGASGYPILMDLSAQQNPQPVLSYAAQPTPWVVAIWCRVAAVVLMALGLERVAGSLAYDIYGLSGGRPPNVLYLFAYTLSTLVQPVFAWICWRRAPYLAMRMTHDLQVEVQTHTLAGSKYLVHVALLLIGVYQLSEALPNMVIRLQTVQLGRIHNLSNLPWGELAMPLMRVCIGLLLIILNRAIGSYLVGFTVPIANHETAVIEGPQG